MPNERGEIMIKKRNQKEANKANLGFSLTEAVITTSIVGILSSIAIPNYLNSNNNAKLANAVATTQSIPPIIGAFIDATGEAPTTWDDLSTISVVMTNSGPATGDLEKPITLQNSIYDLSIEGPTESVYTLTATRLIDKANISPDDENINTPTVAIENKYAIKSCFNISNGASDIKKGVLSDIEDKINCG